MSKPNLDDPQVYKQYDPGDVLTDLHRMPEMCQQAWQMIMNFSLPRGYAKVNKVVILGMGASAIGGDLVSNFMVTEARIPVILHSNYNLPAFVDNKTLVIASSYSGMTEEVLTAFEQALRTEAKKLVVTTGGKLKTMAEEKNIPAFVFDYKAQPRSTLPFSFLTILGFLQRLGLTSDKSADVTETIEVLQKLARRINEGMALSQNPAKQLANKLYGHLPIIYGADILSQVAHRWKTQLNENSKAWSFYEVFPELNHNAVVGYQFPLELVRKIVVVMLRSAHIHKRTKFRYQITCQLLEQAKVKYQIMDGEGKSPLSQMMSLVLLGDYTSYYLGMLYKTDPAPNKAIDWLKEQLKGAES
ncbi:bifunctional phosphoglucose/phosphomannose isomerase [Chloroflexota bacterium]